MTRLVAALLLFALAVTAARAEGPRPLRGVALVIGQSKYAHVPALPNPANDARAIEGLLEELGFEVTGVADRDRKKLARDLERFSEDAEGADVAVVYYSGHGIEAGGENWLVPVDADPADLAEIGDALVPLTAVLDELKSKVAVTIILLDACRSNPFPPGTLARRDGAAVAIAAEGLGTPRGFAAIPADTTDSLGTIIGYAAEPGQPALDGESGGNSPYAAAILRHLSALQGEEFGLVMRMVTEEVYLKTRAQQRPWVNESLRKQLFFGAAPVAAEGDEALITGERRQLLLTIAELPDPQRKKVEAIARSGGVSLDTLYGVLRAIGQQDVPKDGAGLDALLKAQIGRLQAMQSEQRALATDDPELARLMAASDRALAEGAIETARKFLAAAKAEVEKGRDSLEAVAAKLKAKRLANAEVLARSAAAAELDFDFYAAAQDYNAAFDWVKAEDPLLAARYLTRQADALQSFGEQRGDNDALRAAIQIYGLVYRDVPPPGQRTQWAKLQNNLANTYLRLGERLTGTGELETAVAHYKAALSADSDLADPQSLAVTYSNLGIALHTLADRRNDTAMLAEAQKAFAAALARRDKTADPLGWAQDTLNSANLDVLIAQRSGDDSGIAAATARIEEALALTDRTETPLLWARAKINVGVAYRLQGAVTRDAALVRKAADAYRDALTFLDRPRFPMDWGQANGNLAIALMNIGALNGDMAAMEESLGYFRLSFEEVTRERAPEFWARTRNSFGMALQAVSFMKKDDAMMAEAAAALRDALEIRTREVNPLQWAETQTLLASVLSSMASMRADLALADQAIAAYRSALEVRSRERYPAEWRQTAAGLAMTLQGRGIYEPGDASMKQAQAIYLDVLASTSRDTAPLDWAAAMKDVATIEFMLGTKHMVKEEVEQSIRSFDRALEVYASHGSFMDRMMIGAMRGSAVQALDLFK